MAYEWVDCDRNYITSRYDRIASLIPLFEWLFFLPAGLRRRAVERLQLPPGGRVLEIGCGTGRNLPFLRAAVGRAGRVYGVDLSAGMLDRAEGLCRTKGWSNIHLMRCDAADYAAPEPLDGILFSLSFNTMPHHREVLRQAWSQLRPGGMMVIMDAKLPPGTGGRLIAPFSVWLMKQTVLGNPFIRPWEHLEPLVERFEMNEYLFGSYYICSGRKPAGEAWAFSAAAEAAE